MGKTILGSNTSTTPTKLIQEKLGNGLVVDDKYGPQTTAAVKAFQTANGLKADGIFGPITQTAFNNKFTQGSSIVSTDPIHKEAASNSSALDAALRAFNANYTNPTDPNANTGSVSIGNSNVNDLPVPKNPGEDVVTGSTSDPFIQQLDDLSTRSNDSTKMLIQNIKAIKQRQVNDIDKQYNTYKSGLKLLGIQTGAAQGTPDLLLGQIQDAETQHQAKISQLDSDEVKALMDAENARADSDFKVLKEKMDYVAQIKKDKAQALKDYHDSLTNDALKGAQVAKVAAHDIYDTMNTLEDADKESFINAVAKKFNIPVTSVVTALADEKTTREKDSATADKVLSPTEAATLGVPYGTTESQAAKLKITPDRYKETTPSTTATEKSEIQAGKDVLNTGRLPDGTVIGNPKGTDGFVDPGVYTKLFQSWKGTAKDFIAKYPIVGTVNPLSYTKLPDALKVLLPKTKASGSGRTS